MEAPWDRPDGSARDDAPTGGRPAFTSYRVERAPEAEMLRRARAFYEEMEARRSVRHFSSDPVPRELIELAILTASTAPSGAHRQPWRFVGVSDPGIKRAIRIAAEKEEYEMGPVTLTHTPSPMAFLSRILGRPRNERPYVLFPVGYPAPRCRPCAARAWMR